MKEKIGLYIGRFQPFHRGHLSVVRKALEKCDRLVIAIGSAQESRTKKNPWTFEERKKFIWRSLWNLNERVVFVHVDDREEYNDDASWGQYVLDQVEEQCGLRPTINFEGGEPCRSTWFEGIDIERVVSDRNEILFSATDLRKAIINDDYFDFCHMAPNGEWLLYNAMRKVLLEVENGKV